MSSQGHGQVINSLFSAIDAGEIDTLDRHFADGYVAHFPGVPVPLDRAGAKGLFGAFRAAFPNISHNIESRLGEGALYAVRLKLTGTQQAEFNGIPATGKSIDISALNLFRFDGDQITEHWIEFDSLTMLQ